MKQINILEIQDKEYPDALRKIKNPPKRLYFEGNIELLNKPIISIIGSRSCTENGKKLAQKFATELVYQDIVIASGMAKGIDSIAHEATLKSNGSTIAVLGSGFNHIYPKENIKLFHNIIKNCGLVISEYEPNMKAISQNFIKRNRIISGISIGVLIVEAAYRSGTSVTARLALEQNKKVFVLPHEITDSHGVGTNRLIRNGSILVTSTKEIISEFKFLKYNKIKKQIDTKVSKLPTKKELKNKKYEEVYNLITQDIISINDIYKNTNKSMGEINTILFMLEVEGYIKKVPGGYTCILNKK